MDATASGRRRRRRAALVLAAVTTVAALAGCHTAVGPGSLLLVAGDRTVAVDVRCGHAHATCTGTARLRLGGLDSPAVPYSVAAGTSAPVTVTLTDDQYATVPAADHVVAEVVVDDAAPADTTSRVAGPVGLRRTGTSYTEVLGVSTDGGSTALAHSASMSADGRFVAFVSPDPLVATDTDRNDDVYLRDRLTRTTTRVSPPAPHLVEASFPDISADGRFVAYQTAAALVATDVNQLQDIYVHDRLLGTNRLVSVATDATLAADDSRYATISADGRRVAFTSDASNLVAGDTNDLSDVFVHDLAAGVTRRISVATDGTQGDEDVTSAPSAVKISDDGEHVAFESVATTLVAGDIDTLGDVYVHDLATGTTSRVSVTSDGAETGRAARDPVISGDGRYVAFTGAGYGPSPSMTGQVHLHDRVTGATTLLSQDPARSFPGVTNADDISADGRRVLWHGMTNLLGDDRTDLYALDAYRTDRVTGTTTRVSMGDDDRRLLGDRSSGVVISDDGRHAVFTAGAGLDTAFPDASGAYVRVLG